MKTWYFLSESFEERDEFIAQIYINIKNRMETIHGGESKFLMSDDYKNLNYDDNTLRILEKFVVDQEK